MKIKSYLTFGQVVRGLKLGQRFARAGWNGQDMFIYLVNNSTFEVNREPLSSIVGDGIEVNYRDHIDMRTAQGDFVPWVASQTDILAEDWMKL